MFRVSQKALDSISGSVYYICNNEQDLVVAANNRKTKVSLLNRKDRIRDNRVCSMTALKGMCNIRTRRKMKD